MQNANTLINEQELIKKAQSGDVKALEQILVFYMPQVKKIARHYFLVGSDVEDLEQIGYISLTKAIMEFDANKNASFKTFLHLSVHGDIKNEITKSRTDKHKSLAESLSLQTAGEDEEDSWSVILISNEESPEEIAIKKQKVAKIMEFLKQNLSDYERIVVSKYLSCYSYKEIAELTSTTTKKVDNTIAKVKKLIEKFKKEQDL